MAERRSSPALRLRALTAPDCERLLTWIDSPDALWQWSGIRSFTWPLDRGQLLRDLTAHAAPAHLLAAVDERGEMVGHVSIDVQANHHLANIGRVVVAPERRGEGLGTALMAETARVGFDELRLHRLQLTVYTFNAAAIATYRGVGFVAEGVARDAALGSTGYWDAMTMRLLEPEYRRPLASVLGPEVRPSAPRDADGVAALLTRLGHPHDRALAAAQLLEWATDATGILLVAHEQGSVVGVAAVQQQRDLTRPGAHAEALIMAGDDETRRRLRDGAERWALERGLTQVELSPQAVSDA